MSAPENRFKRKLAQSGVQFGCWVGMADSYAAEIAGSAGFDWLLVDGEHAPNDLRSIMTQLQALQGSDSEAVVRLPIGQTHLIKQFLDIGAQSLLVPMVESAEQARELVAAIRYPPEGVRGVGSALARASQFNTIENYLQTANEQICLLIQVESMAGINALDDILQVDGIDGVFIGPADLAADMGHLADAKNELVQDTIEAALIKISTSDKSAGILAMDKPFIDRSIKAGATFVAVGVDVMLYAGALRKLAKNPTNP